MKSTKRFKRYVAPLTLSSIAIVLAGGVTAQDASITLATKQITTSDLSDTLKLNAKKLKTEREIVSARQSSIDSRLGVFDGKTSLTIVMDQTTGNTLGDTGVADAVTTTSLDEITKLKTLTDRLDAFLAQDFKNNSDTSGFDNLVAGTDTIKTLNTSVSTAQTTATNAATAASTAQTTATNAATAASTAQTTANSAVTSINNLDSTYATNEELDNVTPTGTGYNVYKLVTIRTFSGDSGLSCPTEIVISQSNPGSSSCGRNPVRNYKYVFVGRLYN